MLFNREGAAIVHRDNTTLPWVTTHRVLRFDMVPELIKGDPVRLRVRDHRSRDGLRNVASQENAHGSVRDLLRCGLPRAYFGRIAASCFANSMAHCFVFFGG